MTSRHLIIASVLLLAGAGCGPEAKLTYEVHPMLMGVDSRKNEKPVYVGIGADGHKPDSIAVSPDQTHVVSALWENAHYAILLSDLPRQNHSREIAAQTVPEGHGGLDPASLVWVDDRTVQYRESGAACGETGEPSIINPTKNCDGEIVMTYRVDIETGAKTMTDKWMEVTKPLP